MRLLHTESFALHSFMGDEKVPPYAILSHTWGDDEFSFQDHQKGIAKQLENPTTSLQKILNTCKQAQRDKLEFVWVDTCCIDKSSSAELSEAINSMFKWYRNSTVCYAFLQDVTLEPDGNMINFDTSKWFTRGWTLQELIAPHELRFFDCKWRRMRSRWTLAGRISQMTGVSEHFLRRKHEQSGFQSKPRGGLPCSSCGHYDHLQRSLMDEPIAEKMKWAGKRVTTRPEDMAYCLMGLFDVNMPLLYGEGTKAFLRLQEEILEAHPDQSILTSTEPLSSLKGARRPKAYLPEFPSAFNLSLYSGDDCRLGRDDIVKTARGLEVDVLLAPCEVIQHYHDGSQTEHSHNEWLAVLSCTIGPDRLSRVGILLKALRPESLITGFIRMSTEYLVILEPGQNPRVIGTSSAPGISTISVRCSIRDLEQRRVVLQSVPSHAKLYEVPAVKLVYQVRDGWSLKAQWPSSRENILDAGLKKFRDVQGLSIAIRGIFCFTNGKTLIFVILATDDASPNRHFSTDPRYKCWIEPPDSPLVQWFENIHVKDITLGTLRAAQQSYSEYYATRIFEAQPSEVSRHDCKANAVLETTNFLGRALHTLRIQVSK